MSEFSESYHLRGATRGEATSLLSRAGLAGFVFPALDGWVSFVAEGESFKPNKRLLNSSQGVLLRWVFGDDHGWEFNVFDRAKKICDYNCSWDEELLVEGKVNLAQLKKSLGLNLPALEGEAGLKIFYPQSVEQAFEVNPAYAFARAVGLTHFRWLSFEYLYSDMSKGHPLPPDVQVVV